MTHALYEEWLLAGEALTPAQDSELQQHLEGCQPCRALAGAWQQVEPALCSIPPVEPQPGFTARWMVRLAQEKRRLQRRQSLAILTFNVTGASLLVITLAILALPRIGSLPAVIWGALYRLLSVFSLAASVRAFTGGLADALGGGLPLFGLILFVGLLTELAVLWVVSLRLLMRPRGVTQ